MDEAIIDMYVVSEMPMWKIADNVNIAVGTVYNVLKRNGITSRKDTGGVRKHTEESKLKISIAQKGKTVSEETKKKISESRKMHQCGHKKNRCDGYIALYYPDYPSSSKDGYVMEHIYIMEQSIGRKLNDDEVVHHINKIKNDNRIENLMVMTKHDHMSMHMKERHANRKIGGMTYQ